MFLIILNYLINKYFVKLNKSLVRNTLFICQNSMQFSYIDTFF